MRANELAMARTLTWRKIAIALKTPEKGEEKAQSCEMPCLRQLSSRIRMCVVESPPELEILGALWRGLRFLYASKVSVADLHSSG